MALNDPTTRPWWRDAVTYQVYVRSFADSDGDGVGDLPGITARLPYLRDLGVDAVWITPFYPSPQHDHGYDVADYCDVDPLFGDLAAADELLATAHELGLKVIVDLVPNHTSSEHPWFQAALAAGPGSPERARYLFRDGRGEDGSEPPNNWGSVFGGPAWTRVDGRPVVPPPLRHHPARPRLAQPRGRRRCSRTCCGSGSTAASTGSGSTWPTACSRRRACATRSVAPATDPRPAPARWSSARAARRADVGPARGARRLPAAGAGSSTSTTATGWRSPRPGPRPPSRWRASSGPTSCTRRSTSHWLLADVVGQPRSPTSSTARSPRSRRSARAPTWVLSNHDVVRHATRYGGGERGLARARAATLTMLALPGSAYLYQGEELGLEEVDVAREDWQDPASLRTGETGRDGCRVPIPWSGDAAPYGFGPGAGQPWIPQPDDWAALTVEAQWDRPGSTLEFYREALRARRTHALGAGDEVRIVDGPRDMLVVRPRRR